MGNDTEDEFQTGLRELKIGKRHNRTENMVEEEPQVGLDVGLMLRRTTNKVQSGDEKVSEASFV